MPRLITLLAAPIIATLFVAAWVPSASAQQSLTQLWSVAPGSRAYLDGSSYNTRGLAYDPGTTNILVADHTNIYVLSATDGSDKYQMNTVGLPTSGDYIVDQVGVADDGAVFACNLSLDGTGFAVTRFSAISPSPTISAVYSGDPGKGGGDRWGDTMSVRGAGVNTQILLGSDCTNVTLLTTSDGFNFTSVLIAVSNVPLGFVAKGIAFGASNTFWAVGGGAFDVRQIAFNPATVPATATVLQTYFVPAELPNGLCGLSVDPAKSILATVCNSQTPNNLQFYQLSGNTSPPALFHQAPFPASNANTQEVAAVTLKAGRAFGLDANNGIVALSYGAPPPFTITSVAYQNGVGATLTWPASGGRTYQVSYKNALTDPSWTSIGPAIPATGSTASYTDSSAVGATRFYRVQVQ